jgi:hypothetical protein
MEIQLTNCSYFAVIDAEDIENILAHTECWSARFSKPVLKFGYGEKNKLIGVCGRSKITGKVEQLHRVIINYFGPLYVDHKDRNPLNNQKDNLRICTINENLLNKGIKSNKQVGRFKGVSFNKSRGKWIVEIWALGRRHYGGYFLSELEAATKANELMRKYHGEFACLNQIPTI